MVNNYEKISASKAKIMSLEFFAGRFGIRKKFLRWGIEKITTEQDVICIPVIIVKNTDLLIDIMRDSLSSAKSAFGREIKIIPAKMTEQPEDYVFQAKSEKVSLSRQELKKFYASKVLAPELLPED